MAAKRDQLLARIGIGPHPAEADLGVRMRSAVFVLLGLTTAACLAIVAILVHQAVPYLPSLPLPGVAAEEPKVALGSGREADPEVAVAVERLASVVAAEEGANPGHGAPRSAGDGPREIAPAPSSVVDPAANGPAATPVPVADPPPSAGEGAPTPTAAPAPTAAPPTAPAATAGSPTDAQLSNGKSSKSSSGKGKTAVSGAKGGTDAAVPSTKAPSYSPPAAPSAPPMTDAEPDPPTDADPGYDHDDKRGHGHWR